MEKIIKCFWYELLCSGGVKLRKRVFLMSFLILLIASLNQSVLLSSSHKSRMPHSQQTREIYHTGDLIVEGDKTFVIEDTTFFIKGNIIVKENGSLIIRNSHVIVEDTYKNEFWVWVRNRARLNIENSVLEATYTPLELMCIPSDDAELTVKNSSLHWRIGADGGKVTIESSTVVDVWLGGWSPLFINVTNSTIYNTMQLRFLDEQEDVELIGLESDQKIASLYFRLGRNVLRLENTEVSKWIVGLTEFYRKSLTIRDSHMREINLCFDEPINISGIKPGYFENWNVHQNVQGPTPWSLTLVNTRVDAWKLVTLNDAYIENVKTILTPFRDKTVIVRNSEILSLDARGSKYLRFTNCRVNHIRLTHMPVLEEYVGHGNFFIEFENSTLGPTEIAVQYAFIKGTVRFQLLTPFPLEKVNFRKGVLVREYPITVFNEFGEPTPNASINLRDFEGRLVGSTTTDREGKATLNVTFTKENYFKKWTLEVIARSLTFTKEIDLVTDTPIILSLEEALKNVNDDIAYAEAIIEWARKSGRTNNLDEAKKLLDMAKQKYAEGRLGEALDLLRKVVELLWIKIDGDPSDWERIAPLVTDPEGDVEDAQSDLKALFAIMDNRALYLMVEFWCENPPPELFFVDIYDLDRQVGYAVWGEEGPRFLFVSGLLEGSANKTIEVKVPLEPMNYPKTLGLRALTKINKTIVLDTTEWTILSRLSSLSIEVSPSKVSIGEPVTVLGSISPVHSGILVTLTYNMPNKTILTRNVTSTVLGYFKDTFTPEISGSWTVKAGWNGDLDHEGAESQEILFTVLKAKSSISLSISKESLRKDEPITISGSLNPQLAGITITLTFMKPDGTTFSENVLTDSNGSFSWVFTPRDKGEWNMYASWLGNENYEGASSSSLSFLVLPKPAEFKVTDLNITPAEAEVRQQVTISVKVTNIGEEEGSYTVDLKVDGVVVGSKMVTLARGESTTVTFELAKEKVGMYDIEVASLKGSFSVREILPPPPWELYAAIAVVAIIIGIITIFHVRKRKMLTHNLRAV